jgi:hypothetical protein
MAILETVKVLVAGIPKPLHRRRRSSRPREQHCSNSGKWTTKLATEDDMSEQVYLLVLKMSLFTAELLQVLLAIKQISRLNDLFR